MIKQSSGPLAGVRAIEFSVFMAGPACGIMLADLGADVVKVERTPDGDDSRRFRPPAIGGEPAAFMVMNRNKRGVAIDGKTPSGAAALKRLCLSADIVIENFRPGAMDKLGLSYAALSAEKPSLIYGTISGYGSTGPEAGRAGLDLIAQGFSGLMSITGEGPGRPPVKVGAPISDTTAGMLLALGVTAAYAHRLKTGEGQHVETSLAEAAIAHTYWQSAIALATGEAPGPLGSAHPLSAPYQAFQCSDGFVVVGAPNDLNFRRVLEAIGAEALAGDPRFASNADRRANREALADLLAPAFLSLSRAECLARLDRAGVPCGPVHTIPEMLAHPQTRARGMVVTVDHAVAGAVETLGCPIKLSRTPSSVARAAPVFGADNDEVLRELGFSAPEIAAMYRDGALMRAEPPGHG